MHTLTKTAAITLTAILLTACGNASSAPEVGTQSGPITQRTPATPVAKKVRTPMERGKILYKRCKACHTLDEGGKNKVGPNLWNIWNSKAASREGFAYSKALKAADITWDDAALDAYIKKPMDFVPGTRMSFIGIKKEQDRADLLLYMKTQTTP